MSTTTTETKPTEKTPTAAEAKEIAQRFINAAFKRWGSAMPRVSIPCQPNKDDDCQLLRFIDQVDRREQELLSRIQMLESSVAIYRRSEMPEVKQAAAAGPAKAAAADSKCEVIDWPTHAVKVKDEDVIGHRGNEQQCRKWISRRGNSADYSVVRLAPPPPSRMRPEMLTFVDAICRYACSHEATRHTVALSEAADALLKADAEGGAQ